MKRFSISTLVIAALILVVTVMHLVYSLLAIQVYRERELTELETTLALHADLLENFLADALIAHHPDAVNRLLDIAMKDACLAGIILISDDRVYVRSRSADWEVLDKEPTDPTGEFFSQERILSHDGIRLGSLSLYATPKFLNQELRTSLFVLTCSILIPDVLLVLIFFWLLNRIVLKPLNSLKAYAGSIVSGVIQEFPSDNSVFSGELEELRISLEKMVSMLESRFGELQRETMRLKASEERFRTLVGTIPDLIWLKDADGVYLACNRMFERFFGAKENEIVGKTDYDFVEREQADFFREHDRKAMTAGGPSRNEEWITFVEGGQRALLETTKTPMVDGEGGLIGVLGIGHDITLRKQAEEEKTRLETRLLQAQKLEAVGRLAGGVAHDFNNMLSVILGRAELALHKLDDTNPLYESLQEICNAARRSADLTRQLLAFARQQAISPETLDLNQTVSGMLSMLQRLIGEEIALSWQPANGLWPLRMDRSQVDQILANLCVNARDSIDGLGKIFIETGNTHVSPADCSDCPDSSPGDYVRLSVTDDGRGMDRETAKNIFEPFFTTKKTGQGTGLGLATVYGIVRQNGGFVRVDSQPGAGATFSIFLPRYEGSDRDIAPAQDRDAQHDLLQKILVVEDAPQVLSIVSQMLTDLGYDVVSANTPSEAIRLAEQLTGEIDLMISDVIMPEMNGRDLANKLLKIHPHLVCLYMSGYTADVIAHHGVLDEGVHFIEKPFTTETLSAKIREVMAGRRVIGVKPQVIA